MRRLALTGLALLLLAGCGRHKHKAPDVADSQEPDKVLYERALGDIEKGRFEIARLTLQTLLNAYPDSDYLAAAKLAIADSYFEEGTTSALTHAEVEYKDYITFFPSDPKAAFAQYRAAMCHYRQLEKPDRDRTHSRRAEEEFQYLLLQFPESEYAAEGERKLVQVQELLADSEFRVARFYFIKESWRASASRLVEMVERYPNYSKRDEALWMLGRAYLRELPYYWPRDPERAGFYLTRLLREHPLSSYADDARAELAQLGQPIPEPDPVLLARAQSVKPYGNELEERHEGLLGRLFGAFGILNSRPDLSEAAPRLGPPPLEPPKDMPSLPPPNLAAATAKRGSTVTATTVGELPSGTVVGTAPEGEKKPEGKTDEKKSDKPAQDLPKRKKSFWRKLVPFF